MATTSQAGGNHGQRAATFEEILRAVFESPMEMAVMALDPHGRIVRWLPGAERVFGYTSEEVLGRDVAMLFPPEDVQAGTPEWEREVAVQQGHAEDDRWMLRKDGMRIWATGLLVAARRDGEILGFGKLLRNRTDLKAQLESRDQAVRSMRDAEERQHAALATMAHELRNPLSSILTAAGLISMNEPESEDSRLAISSIQRAVDKMRRLIDDLTDLTRIRTGKLQLHLETTPLQSVLASAVQSCRDKSEERRQHLALIAPEVPVMVHADASRLQQVFVNLVENAIKYTPPEGQVLVTLTLEGDEAVSRVEDNGIGISAELLPRVFDLFTQAHAASQPNRGLGIGLSVVEDLVTLHGGSVQVRSDGVGKGSQFAVRLPLAGGERQHPDHPAGPVEVQ